MDVAAKHTVNALACSRGLFNAWPFRLWPWLFFAMACREFYRACNKSEPTLQALRERMPNLKRITDTAYMFSVIFA